MLEAMMNFQKTQRKYIERIEEFTGTRVSIVSVGPKRDQTMRVKEL